ncbi:MULTISPECIES: ABC transporter ATP-binding protein [unclassified Enterococcus]|uniref:ABC transporter ATP-binding protein n=1 Tax=unclassified Enterococcus TaxID=2608891 RepID=UPI001553DCFC|nr:MULTISPECIES: ABC transporter ATP-binding protein [unclassified Enterococcus]MBS7576715.1 ABC transporter ATP-binding protein [Enterococcus sp. MMGLQ5-2]MBS7583798.1 ABC transporter ATP-binding protein [Enterococcus sp. MMGLQ5-1]NPD11659.1 ABC transporter ATP-binding protein [Enterococcus sp. MMGLQ5-1]NPD36552.1 ABC transporter ATP-binding protein [Enterococcus sp. MMGLQ5-2]
MNISIENLNKTYLRRGKNFNAFQTIDLKINAGEFIAIVGPSGSGKTTFLHLLAGLLTQSSGAIKYDGLDFANIPKAEKAAFINDNIGFISQGMSLIPSLCVVDNLRLPLYLSKREHQAGVEINQALALLAQLGIEDLADEYPINLSGGEQRRVAIARAVMNHPKIIIADEPTNDLDDVSKAKVLELFKQKNQAGATVIMVTHHQENLAYVNQVYTMN